MEDHPTENLSSEVFAVLRERIVRWEYAPSHRFTEEALCEEFGMSRSPVREALRMLVENRLVDKTPRKGYTVRQLELREVMELYEVRIALEMFVVQRLVELGYAAEDLERLTSSWEALKKRAAVGSDDFADKDEQFHESLAKWTGNATLLQQIRDIDDRLHFVRMTDIASPGRWMTTCEQHLRILECIKQGNADCAKEAVRANIEDGRMNVQHAIKEALARAYLGPKAGAS